MATRLLTICFILGAGGCTCLPFGSGQELSVRVKVDEGERSRETRLVEVMLVRDAAQFARWSAITNQVYFHGDVKDKSEGKLGEARKSTDLVVWQVIDGRLVAKDETASDRREVVIGPAPANQVYAYLVFGDGKDTLQSPPTVLTREQLLDNGCCGELIVAAGGIHRKR